MKIIATDLDRTLVPNGRHRLTLGAMALFRKLVSKNRVRLIYVTGRYPRLILDGIKRYRLPAPDYVIGFVGTAVYRFQNNKLVEDKVFQQTLERQCPGCEKELIKKILTGISGLREQEPIKQYRFKQSYYIPLGKTSQKIIAEVKQRLKKATLNTEVLESVDVNRQIGLLDVVPMAGNKLSALDYVLVNLGSTPPEAGQGKKQVLFAGDSGNDLDALASGQWFGVLVKNASKEVKDKLDKLAKQKKLGKKIYVAQGNFTPPDKKLALNGNYVSGIIEGAFHFGLFH